MARDEVELTLPEVLYGGDLRGFLDFLGLQGRPLGVDGRWVIWPNNDRIFFSHHNLADDTEFANRFDHLSKMPMAEIAFDADSLERVAELDRMLADRMSGGSDIAALFYSIQSDILKVTDHNELITAVEQACGTLAAVPLESTGDLLFPGVSAHLIIATELLTHRVRLPAIMFRFDQDPDALKTIASLGDEGGYFASSSNWFSNVIGASHYFGPLLGCMAPGFWCVPTARPPAAILFNLGVGIAGYRHTPMEPMQLLPAEGRDEVVSRNDDITPESGRVAVTWWTNRLNQMFGYLCDPTVFANKHGEYDPYEHQHWLLTFGQVFELTTAVQTSSRNHAVQRALMNTLLDSYADRIMVVDFNKLCRHDYARDTADRIRVQMPATVAALLMPLADRAVDGLRRVQDGFFLQRQRGDQNVVVRIPGNDQGQHREPARAAAILLKLYRNATHGFGGNRQPQNDKDLVAERLLSHHTGKISDDLVYLPYLYLLATLCAPQRVRETIVTHARSRG